ncbi:BrxA family protein [Nocardia rhamnosiphila]
MPDAAYHLSFTTGGLLRAEAAAVAAILLSTPDVATARVTAISRNVVQQRSAASTARVTREVLQRLATLPRPGLELLAYGAVNDGRHLMWYAACVRYRFLRDFGREVLCERPVVTLSDFDTFWNLQSAWVDALRDAAESTRNKLRQNTFRIIREAGYLDSEGQVRQAMPGPTVMGVIRASDPKLLLSFPLDAAHLRTVLHEGEH